MSTTSTTSSTGSTAIDTTGITSTSTLTNSGAGGTLQEVGLGSGINTTALITAELSSEEAPMTNLENEITGLKTEDTTLSNLQSALQAVSLDAQLLAEPSSFFNAQTLSSSNSSLVSAGTTNGVGVPVGSYTVAVSQLASSAQAAFAYTAPTDGSDTLSISDGVNPAETVTVAAGTTTQTLADQINSDNSLTVYAAVDSSGNLVLSSRSTGSNYSISATDETSSSNLVAGTTTAGQDCEYTVNGTAGTSHSDTVTGAVPDMTLSFAGVTGSTPVTITAAKPGPSVSNLSTMIDTFVTDYNTAMTDLNAAVMTEPSSTSDPSSYNPNSGSLFGDPTLEGLISSMRNSMITNGSGLTAGLAAMSDLGITTGTSTGSATQASVEGLLSFNSTTFASLLSSNPDAVKSIIQKWATSFQTTVNAQAGPGQAMAVRINGNTTLATSLQSEYSQMQTNYTEREQSMEDEWAAMEATLTDLKSSSTYLTELYNSTTSSSSSSSSS